MTRRAFFGLLWVLPGSPPTIDWLREHVIGPMTWIVPSLPRRDLCAEPGCQELESRGPGVDYMFCQFHADQRADRREAARSRIEILIRNTVQRGAQTGELSRMVRRMYGR